MIKRVKDYQDILDRVKFRDWSFEIREDLRSDMDTPIHYLQVEFNAGDLLGPALQKGRKWLLSEHMTDGEVVQTALMAVLAALEHEAREEFTYKGHAIFGPHYDLEVLVAVCETGHGDSRRAPIEGVGPDTALKGLDHDGVLQGLREADVEPFDPFRRER